MASKGAVLPLLRRELRSSVRFARANPSASVLASRPSHPLSTSSRQLARRSAPFAPVAHIRAFSQSVVRPLTDENGEFDPRAMDRESDEVDVCIVGGGMCNSVTRGNLIIYVCLIELWNGNRSRRSRRRN